MAETETYILNMGPQHPSTHGVLQVQLRLDGEKIVSARPVMGYLHRGIEKLLESRTYLQGAPYTDRLDYLSSMNANLGYSMAVEELAGIEVPRRAEYIRVIMAELNRIASHFVFIGTLAIDLGASTGMIYTFRDREKILDLFQLVCGARMTFHYIRIGGVARDIQGEFVTKTYDFLNELPKIVSEYDELLTGNEIFYKRLLGTSIMTQEEALSYNMSGPNLRATGVDYDIRKIDGYSVYPEFSFDVCTGNSRKGSGDNWDRYLVRFNEIKESAKIVREALDGLPTGDFRAKIPRVLKPPKGEIYSRTESSRGEFGVYIVSDGTTKPYRVHFRRPSFINLQALDKMCKGLLLSDSVVAFSSVDPLMGEVDC